MVLALMATTSASGIIGSDSPERAVVEIRIFSPKLIVQRDAARTNVESAGAAHGLESSLT